MNISIKHSIKAEIFTLLFQHFKAFTDHVNLIFERERLYIQSMDSSHISIFEINLPKEWFDIYEFSDNGDENHSAVTIGIHTGILFKVLNARDKSQEINFVYTPETDGDKLYINYTSEVKTEFDKHFEISLLDVDAELMSIPTDEYEAEFSISSYNFANIINQLKMFGDNLEVCCNENKIMMSSTNQTEGKMSVEIKIDDLSSFIIDEGGDIKMSFSLNSLHNICLYNKLSKEVNVSFKNNFPLKVIYTLYGHENARVIFFLAPKINTNDDD